MMADRFIMWFCIKAIIIMIHLAQGPSYLSIVMQVAVTGIICSLTVNQYQLLYRICDMTRATVENNKLSLWLVEEEAVNVRGLNRAKNFPRSCSHFSFHACIHDVS